jgi:hypothetical protein
VGATDNILFSDARTQRMAQQSHGDLPPHYSALLSHILSLYLLVRTFDKRQFCASIIEAAFSPQLFHSIIVIAPSIPARLGFSGLWRHPVAR